MLPLRIIPCLDVRDGRVVKGVRFLELRDQGDPVELARAYETQGADEVVVLDVSATPEGRRTALDVVGGVRRALSMPLTVGGGVRRISDAQALLEAGADKVGVNSAAAADPSLLGRLAGRFGSQCVVASIDAARVGRSSGVPSGYEVVVRSGTTPLGMDAVGWALRAAEEGAGEILLTSIDRDGTREGYDLELLRRVREMVNVPIVASGGADDPKHMTKASSAGADAVLAASIFHQGAWTVGAIKEALLLQGVSIRPEGPLTAAAAGALQ